MKKYDLMRYANNVLGVETRQAGPDGKKNRYRAVEDVKQDCKAAQARLCQPPQENEPLEAPAEANSSSREAPFPSPERAPSVEGGVANKQTARQKGNQPWTQTEGHKSRVGCTNQGRNLWAANVGEYLGKVYWSKACL